MLIEDREYVRRFAESLPDSARILDAGAGRMQYRDLFFRQVYIAFDNAQVKETEHRDWDLTGIDKLGDIEDLPFENEFFDGILCTSVLEHVRHPREVIEEFHRVLKPGGRLCITAPQSWPMHQIPYDFFRYTRYGLESMLGEAGFEITDFRGTNYFHVLRKQLGRFEEHLFHPENHFPVTSLFRLAVKAVLWLQLFALRRLEQSNLDKLGIETGMNQLIAVKIAG